MARDLAEEKIERIEEKLRGAFIGSAEEFWIASLVACGAVIASMFFTSFPNQGILLGISPFAVLAAWINRYEQARLEAELVDWKRIKAANPSK
jgi:hypothetical protein